MNTTNRDTCGDCGAEPGQLHDPGCDVERCPRCGFQAIGCDCIYEIHDIDPSDMDETHPGLYENGPTDAMYARWDAEWGPRRMPWSGEWPGVNECREYGWYARMVEGRGWVRCEPGDEEASEDLNRLLMEAEWDADRQRFVRRRGNRS